MSNLINYDADQLIQSQSPMGPFISVFEKDSDTSIFYAVLLIDSEPKIQDQVILRDLTDIGEILIQWNESGTRSALICNERIVAVFDYEQHITFSSDVVTEFDSQWVRQQIQFSNDLVVEFGLDQFFKQIHLDIAIQNIKKDDSQINRLRLYKELLKSQLFVPITTSSPDDPNALIYTFSNSVLQGVTNVGNLICSFTNIQVFSEQMGPLDLVSQKIAADFLCFQAQKFDDILGLTITSSNMDTVLLTRDEFTMLSLISEPQRLDTNALLKQLGDIFFQDVFSDSRQYVEQIFNEQLVSHSLIRSAYFCRPKVGDESSSSMICIIVNSLAPSSEFDQLISLVKDLDFKGAECQLFSLSDVVAQALEKSMTPLVVFESAVN